MPTPRAAGLDGRPASDQTVLDAPSASDLRGIAAAVLPSHSQEYEVYFVICASEGEAARADGTGRRLFRQPAQILIVRSAARSVSPEWLRFQPVWRAWRPASASAR